MWGTLMDYWHYTGDSSYNDVIIQAMMHQTGDNADFMDANWTATLGNDDQGFWGMSAMLAAELNFPNPDEDKPQWLALAQAVWNTQAAPDRHDDKCGGGLRWQIPFSNNGYNYKNSIANGCFFNIGARLARYLDNETYLVYAEETWDWMVGVGYVDESYNVYDGGHVEYNCTDINKAQFSYNVAIFAQGMAYLYNYVRFTLKDPPALFFQYYFLLEKKILTVYFQQTNGGEKWKTALDGLVENALNVFFPNDTAYEIACEDQGTCTTDMLSFKGYVHRWLSQITWLAPYLSDKILPVMRTSAERGLATCTGGDNGRRCGFTWSKGVFDETGAGQQMNVLAAVSSLLVSQVDGPVTNTTGGTSIGDYNAGSDSDDFTTSYRAITTGDKFGAAVLTILVAGAATGTFGWMSWGEQLISR